MKHKTYKSWLNERKSSACYLGTDLGQGAWDYLEQENQKLKKDIKNLNLLALRSDRIGVLEQENQKLREHKIYYDRIFAKSVVVKTEEYSEMVQKIDKLKKLLDLAMGELSAILPEMYWLYKQATNEFINKTKDDSSCVTIYKRARATREKILKQLGELK